MDQMMKTPTEIERRKFFAWSDLLDHDVLRPLSHIRGNWEVRWDTGEQKYAPEEDSFAHALNELIDCIATSERPERYHDNEDVVAKYLAAHPNSKISKEGNRWIGAEYIIILQDGGLEDIDQENLRLAATGRVCAAIERGQMHFDDMEVGHRQMLATIMTLILYHSAEF